MFLKFYPGGIYIMKKSIFSAAVVALIAPIVLSTSANAATQTSMDSKATISFTGNPEQPSGPVNPTDPSDPKNPDNPGTPEKPDNNPDQPVNPTKPVTTGLYLVTAPSFNFGSHKINDGALKDINPTLASNKSGLYYAQISDTRTGGIGWKLSVNNTPFTGSKTDGGANVGDELKGANLTIGQATSILNNASATPNKPVTAGITSTAQTLDGSGTNAIIAQAEKGNGNMVTSINWAPSQIKLSTPTYAATSGETYTSTLTWTLASTEG